MVRSSFEITVILTMQPWLHITRARAITLCNQPNDIRTCVYTYIRIKIEKNYHSCLND